MKNYKITKSQVIYKPRSGFAQLVGEAEEIRFFFFFFSLKK